MPWIIGIDEAGYGPNLGPFVMSAVACCVPRRLASADLWHVLRAAVRRAAELDDGRLLIADSKLVYAPARGLEALEAGVLSFLVERLPDGDWTLADCLKQFCPSSCPALAGEIWYAGDSRLPQCLSRDEPAAISRRLGDVCAKRQVQWTVIQSIVICPRAFNSLLAAWGSKGAVLSHALAQLIQDVRAAAPAEEALGFIIDKHGGRNYYAAMLQAAVPDAMLIARRESAASSVYRAAGLKNNVEFTFEPRADQRHFCVALASMVSKYLREALMAEFNRFWQRHIPHIKPTAGYPTDAARFFSDIMPIVRRLGIEENALWRRR